MADPARRTRAFVTPEGVDLRLDLATVGERAAAFLIDLMLLILVLVLLSLFALFALFGTGRVGMEVIAILWLLGFFVLRNGYFAAFELGSRAATIGKRVLKLRVVARDGGRLSGHAVVARNAMRELEFFLPLSLLASQHGQEGIGLITAGAALAWSGLFLLFPLLNRDHMRVGDLVAGTWVIRQPRRRLHEAVVVAAAADPAYVFTEAQLGAYGEFELQKLEEVLRREDELAMIVVARTIRSRIDWAGPDTDDRAFLHAYYAALCARLERGMLFGRRRADKHAAG